MITIRRATDRGHGNHGWLNSYHTFSFAGYRDPDHMGFRSLRVINEDRVAPGQGFGTHSHDNMEIVSYVLEGQLEHKDSMGNGETLTPGEFQRISAGTGIEHSEFNPSSTTPVHFYQIWLTPNQKGVDPSYDQRRFADAELNGKVRLVASPTGEQNSIPIHSDARVYLSKLAHDQSVELELAMGRFGWLQVLRGSVTVSGNLLHTSDAVAISEETKVTMTANSNAEVMFFDLA